MRALVEDKARALLVAGAVTIDAVDEVAVVATVRGHHGSYTVTWHLGAGWRCECPERRHRCSHVLAVRRVTEPADGAPT